MANLVMLDLNDTLIGSHRKDGFVVTMDEWFILDGAVEAVRSLQEAGFKTAVVTNQPAAHRFEEVTHDQMWHLVISLKEWWAERLLEELPFHVCWHDKEHKCLCRKPGTELLLGAMAWADAAVGRDRVWMVGDKYSDIEAGRSVNAFTMRIGRYPCGGYEVGDASIDMTEAAGRIICE